jgi:hypothetical protein
VYIWKTSELSKEIKEDKITDSEWRKYILAWLIIYTLSLYMMSMVPYENSTVMLAELIGTIGAIIFGIGITYKSNKSNGFTYIPRFVALSIPLFFRMGALSLLGGALIGVLGETIISADLVDWLSAFLVVALQVAYYWRVNVHLLYINT